MAKIDPFDDITKKAWFDSRHNRLIEVEGKWHHTSFIIHNWKKFDFENVMGFTVAQYRHQYEQFGNSIPEYYDEQIILKYLDAGWVRLSRFNKNVAAEALNVKIAAKGVKAWAEYLSLPIEEYSVYLDITENVVSKNYRISGEDNVERLLKYGRIPSGVSISERIKWKIRTEEITNHKIRQWIRLIEDVKLIKLIEQRTKLMIDQRHIDWSQCRLVESVPERVSGVPVLKGSRMPVQTIVDNYDAGMMPTEIAEQWQITLSEVQMILEYREKQIAGSIR